MHQFSFLLFQFNAMKTTILVVILALSSFAKEEEKSQKKRGVTGDEYFHDFNHQINALPLHSKQLSLGAETHDTSAIKYEGHVNNIALPQHNYHEIDLGTTVHVSNVKNEEEKVSLPSFEHQHIESYGGSSHEDNHHKEAYSTFSIHQKFDPKIKVEITKHSNENDNKESGSDKSKTSQYINFVSHDEKSKHGPSYSTVSVHRIHSKPKLVTGYSHQEKQSESHSDHITFHGKPMEKESKMENFEHGNIKFDSHGGEYEHIFSKGGEGFDEKLGTAGHEHIEFNHANLFGGHHAEYDQMFDENKADNDGQDHTGFNQEALLDQHDAGHDHIFTESKSDNDGQDHVEFNHGALLEKHDAGFDHIFTENKGIEAFDDKNANFHVQDHHEIHNVGFLEGSDGKTSDNKNGQTGNKHEIDLGSSVHQHITITKKVGIPVPHPYPVHVEKKIPVPVPHPVPVYVDKPYTVHVAKPYPVLVDKPIPYTIYKNIPVPVKVAVKVPVKVPVAVPVPHPYPVLVHKKVPVHVPEPVVIKKSVPFIVKVEKSEHQADGWKH